MSQDTKPPTPGPWHWNDRGWIYADVPDGILVGPCPEDVAYYGGYLVAESVSRCNGPLLAAAPDHALVLAAIAAGKATFESDGAKGKNLLVKIEHGPGWNPSDVWLRFPVEVDAFGCPILTPEMRTKLLITMPRKLDVSDL